jgi:hypothetical protein
MSVFSSPLERGDRSSVWGPNNHIDEPRVRAWSRNYKESSHHSSEQAEPPPPADRNPPHYGNKRPLYLCYPEPSRVPRTPVSFTSAYSPAPSYYPPASPTQSPQWSHQQSAQRHSKSDAWIDELFAPISAVGTAVSQTTAGFTPAPTLGGPRVLLYSCIPVEALQMEGSPCPFIVALAAIYFVQSTAPTAQGLADCVRCGNRLYLNHASDRHATFFDDVLLVVDTKHVLEQQAPRLVANVDASVDESTLPPTFLDASSTACSSFDKLLAVVEASMEPLDRCLPVAITTRGHTTLLVVERGTSDGTFRYHFFDSLKRDRVTGMPEGNSTCSGWVRAETRRGILDYLSDPRSSMAGAEAARVQQLFEMDEYYHCQSQHGPIEPKALVFAAPMRVSRKVPQLKTDSKGHFLEEGLPAVSS